MKTRIAIKSFSDLSYEVVARQTPVAQLARADPSRGVREPTLERAGYSGHRWDASRAGAGNGSADQSGKSPNHSGGNCDETSSYSA